MKRTKEGERFKNEQPAEYAKLAKAMSLSKGKVDTNLGQRLAKVAEATPEDIARLGRSELQNEHYCSKVWNTKKDELRGKQLKNYQAKQAYMYSFKDTFAYRYLVKLGVIQAYEKDIDARTHIAQKYITVSPEHSEGGYDPGLRRGGYHFKGKVGDYRINNYTEAFFNIVTIPMSVRKRALKDKFVIEVWTSAYNEYGYPPYLTEEELNGMTQKQFNEQYRRKQNEFKALDAIGVGNAPQEIKDQISEWLKGEKHPYCGVSSYRYHPISKAWYQNTQLHPWELAKELELEDFYKALEYMGIGIVCMEKYGGSGHKGVTQIVRHVNATTRQFVADVKKGFDPKSVREMVVQDLNAWMKGKVDNDWRFFVRTDAPATYPDIQTKKHKKPSVKETADFVSANESAMVNYIKQNMTLKEE